MDTNPLRNADKPKDGVARLWVAAFRKVVIDILHIHIHLDGDTMERLAACARRSGSFFGYLLYGAHSGRGVQLQEHIAKTQNILFLLRNGLVEVAHRLVA